jgi:hypothetical protein
MKRFTKTSLLILGLALATTLAVAPAASAQHVRVFVGGGFGGGYGFYGGPYWGPTYWGPGYGYGYAYGPSAGEVKIDTKVKDAQVFINGAFAGTTHDNKTMHLRPGSYTIAIREGEATPFNQTVFVAAGKTVHLHPAL